MVSEKDLATMRAAALQAALDGNCEQAAGIQAIHDVVSEAQKDQEDDEK